MFPSSVHDDRIQAKEYVLGIELAGVAKAYPLARLKTASTNPVVDRIANRAVSIHFDGAGAWAEAEGEPIAAVTAYWFAWTAFHPDTELWSPLATGVVDSDADGEGAERVTIVKTDSYWTSMGGGFALEAGSENHSSSGLFVISGILRNDSPVALKRVWLRFDLLDAAGVPVHSERGVNRLAEDSVEMSDAELDSKSDSDNPRIAPGETDHYRMIFIGNEIPEFVRAAVTPVSAR
jgi:hypothetical protein